MSKHHYPSIGYPGGKSKVAKKIIEKMPKHDIYVEPFAGAAHVFFKKHKANKNVLNDKNHELISFFKNVKNKKTCCKVKDSKKKFVETLNKPKKSVCDYLYLSRTSYGSKGIFDGSAKYANRKKKINKEICIDGSKLNGVKLTTDSFEKTIQKYDSKKTLFYIDPPYVKANEKTCLYGKGMCEVKPKDVAVIIRKIKGKAIVSYDNHPTVRNAFKDFKQEKIVLPYSFAKKGENKIKGKTKELIIKTF